MVVPASIVGIFEVYSIRQTTRSHVWCGFNNNDVRAYFSYALFNKELCRIKKRVQKNLYKNFHTPLF